MKSYLIKDTTREEREQIVADSIGNIDGSCDGCASGLIDMYQDYETSTWNSVHTMFPVMKARSRKLAVISCK